MRMKWLVGLLFASGLAVSGCSSSAPDMTTDLGAAQDLATPALPPVGTAITAPANAWTWVDFPSSACDDGTPTGIAVNLMSSSKDLFVFLNGGGACWDYTTCVQLNTSTHGPFGAAEWSAMLANGLTGSVLDRAAPNPFGTFNMAFVPYCTGDIHGGDNVIAYSNGTDSKVFHHKGRANVIAYLTRLAATVPAGGKIVVSGSSAGGFGTNMVYDLFHHYFPNSKIYLFDDSGPLFIGDAISPVLRNSWYASWGLDRTLGQVCPTCKQDMSALITNLAAQYPTDRMALLSYTQDGVIRAYFGQSDTDFQTNLYSLATTKLDTLPQFHYYFVTGTSHTFLAKPAATTAQGVPLWTWITRFVSDDAAWASTKP